MQASMHTTSALNPKARKTKTEIHILNFAKIKERMRRVLPQVITQRWEVMVQLRGMERVKTLSCDASNLRRFDEAALGRLFASEENEISWLDAAKKVEALGIPDGTGGVNPGDRRALYYLIKGMQASSALEFGTHIGASTVHIAWALSAQHSKHEGRAKLITVDIKDVNDPVRKPWLEYGAKYSPAELLNEVGVGSMVEFVTETSLCYLGRCERKFDFIFLDGDHSAEVVYHEIPAALKLLNQNGVILLHDYFPDLRPLWSEGSMLPGPFLAVERLRKEGVNVVAKPLGKLPWPTKFDSNVTSLALLLRE
jgi:predicted O-methyltransferase YrrM